MKLLLIFLAGAAVFHLQRLLYKRIWDRGLEVRVSFSDAFIYEGQAAKITEEVVNDKGFPLPALEIRFALDRNLVYLRESAENASLSDKNYRRDVFSLFSRQKKIRTFALSCEKRGYYRIDEAELVGYDYFFQKKYYETKPQHTAIYVYPHLADVRRIRNVCLAIKTRHTFLLFTSLCNLFQHCLNGSRIFHADRSHPRRKSINFRSFACPCQKQKELVPFLRCSAEKWD